MGDTFACCLSLVLKAGSGVHFASGAGRNPVSHEALNVYHRLVRFRFFSSVFGGQKSSSFLAALRSKQFPPSVIKNIRRMLHHKAKDGGTFISLIMHLSDVTGKYILVFRIGYKSRGRSLLSPKIPLNSLRC